MLCILFFVKGANDLSATQTESLLRTPASVAVIQAGPAPNPEARAQATTTLTPGESGTEATHLRSGFRAVAGLPSVSALHGVLGR